MEKVVVDYDGEYPCMCSGTLTIRLISVSGVNTIYSKKYSCHSTGSVRFGDGDEEIISGILEWDDANYFSEDIQNAVKEKLSEYSVCCGGCI